MWPSVMEAESAVNNRPTIGDTILAGVRQHLEAASRNFELCEMLEVGYAAVDF